MTWHTSRVHVTSTESSWPGIRARWTLLLAPPRRRSAVDQLSAVLDSPEIAALVSDLEATRRTGRPGYPIRSVVGMALAKSIYAVPTWTRLVALVSEHPALRAAITRGTPVPSVYACHRFTTSSAPTAPCSPRALTA